MTQWRTDRECAADGCDYKLGHGNKSGYCTPHLKQTPAYVEKNKVNMKRWKEKQTKHLSLIHI